MDNKKRVKKVESGIKQIKNGEDPWVSFISDDHNNFLKEYGISELGFDILILNGGCLAQEELLEQNGFKYSDAFDMTAMLHNWERFLELIKDLK